MPNRFAFLCLVVVAHVARAQLASSDTGALALLDSPLMKALGVKNPVPDSGVYKAKAGTLDVWMHNKTSDTTWVAVMALPGSPNALASITQHVTLTAPVLVIATTAASSRVDALPEGLKPSLGPVATDGSVSWLVGANLISRADSNTETAKKLKDPRIALFPATGGMLLTGTLGAALLEQLGGGTLAPPSTDWSVGLTMRTGPWQPANSPLSAKGVVFGLSRAATGLGTGAVTFDASLENLTLAWPGFTTPPNANAKFSFTWAQTDFAVAGSLDNVIPRIPGSPLNISKLGFFYATRGLEKDLGLSISFVTKMPGGAAQQAWTASGRVSNTGTIAFKGTLDSNWPKPFNLDGASLLAGSGIEFAISSAEPSIGFGIAGNLKVDTDTFGASLCFDATGSALKAFGLSFSASKLSTATQLGWVGSILNATSDGSSAAQNNARAFAAWKADVDKLPLPVLTNAKIELYTPGLSACTVGSIAGKQGLGATLNGNATVVNSPVGALANTFALNGDANDGLFIDNTINAFTFPNSTFSMGNSRLKVVAPLSLTSAPNSQMLIIGSATAGPASGAALEVRLSAKQALFDFNAGLQGLGKVKLNAASNGPSLAQMNDFTVTASLETDPNLKASITGALKPMLVNGAAARKAANKDGYDRINAAQAKFDTINARVGAELRRLSDAANQFVDGVGRCLSANLDACLKAQRALADFKASDNYGRWLVAATELEWAKSTYATQKATFELWASVEQEVSKANSSFAVNSASLSGSLAKGVLTLTTDSMMFGKPVRGSFTVPFGTGVTLGTGKESTDFVTAVERANADDAPKPPKLWGTGPLTSTTLAVAVTNGKLVATAKVFTPEGGAMCEGREQRPTGGVSLYLRRPGQPAIDRKTALPISTANVNASGSCPTPDVVKFNEVRCSESQGTGCCDGPAQGANVDYERGTFFLSAGYNGGPTWCGADNDPMSGTRASLSDEVMVVVGRPDDVGGINPGESKWGSWREEVTCPAGTWARSFGQRVEPKNKKGDDDSALNSVRLTCAKPNGTSPTTITSHEGWWGDWAEAGGCGPGKFLNAVRIRLEDPQGGKKDDTAANDVTFRCSDGTEQSAGNGTLWGDWTAYKECPAGSAVCGLSIKLEVKKGKDGDDTAMNGLRLRCCAL